jgi:ABC-type lipoprotein export system ATPase subunit
MSPPPPARPTSQPRDNGRPAPPACAGDPLIELKQVVKVFRSSAGEFTALKGVDLCFGRGEFTAIMGKSGSGKSTLINMITGIDHPTSGEVRVGEVIVTGKSDSALAVWRGKTLGIVFQFFQLLPTLSVLENTLLPMDFCNVFAPSQREARARNLLSLVGLDDVADKLPAALSGGQQQTAAIARALANDPPIIVADEPTGNLDSRTAERVLGLFEDLAGRGKTILIVTHDPELARRSTRQVLISDGELIGEPIARALPHLAPPLLLKLTHALAPRSYAPGAPLARQGAIDTGLFVITQGQVEVWRTGEPGRPELVGRLAAGEFFSALELLEAEDNDLAFRAAPEGSVETLALGLEPFHRFLAEHPAAGPSLRQAAAQRVRATSPRGAAAPGAAAPSAGPAGVP